MSRKPITAWGAGILLIVSSCSNQQVESSSIAEAEVTAIAREYVRLVLAMGAHDESHVDAYFGPEEWRREIEDQSLELEEILDRARRLEEEIAALPSASTIEDLRKTGLAKRVTALMTRGRMIAGEKLTFDEESVLLYDASAPHHDAEYFDEILTRIEELLPGPGPLAERVESFRNQFVIPPERLDSVFRTALEECRQRTLAQLELPPGESFTIEYVTGKPWSGYNWYQGRATSLIQINTDLPIFIDRAIDLGCHEGYPGHHTYNALLEQNLVDGRGWMEFSVYPLFSPQSLIAEGSANYGITLAFPSGQRVEFERRTLFPLAGLDADEADRYYQLLEHTQELTYAGNEAARAYLDGDFTREQTVDWLVRYTLMSPERAAQRVDFFDAYRSYVINYNLGRDLVADWIANQVGDNIGMRWKVFTQLLSSPMGPGDIR